MDMEIGDIVHKRSLPLPSLSRICGKGEIKRGWEN
jgi:hypothetical protein